MPGSTRRRRTATSRPSGCGAAGARGLRRGRCTSTTTWCTARTCTHGASWGSRSGTCACRWPSCTSPTGWGTPCTSPSGWGRRRCCTRDGSIRRYQPTLFFGVPTAYAAMLATEGPRDLGRVRLCVSAGEPLPAALFTRWKERFGVEILDGIGSTEALHIYISNRPGRVRPGSSGEVVPGYQVRIVDEQGQDLPPGEIGDLLVSGESVAAYYWNKHAQTKRAFLGEWFRSGDTYYRDAEGYYWYCARSDDMLKVSGQWVSPAEVEATLVEHPAVLESGVVGRLDRDELVKPCAFVVLKPGYEPTEALAREIQAFVRERIAPHKYPRWIEFVPELPKTATGKIQRFRLRELLAQQSPAPS